MASLKLAKSTAACALAMVCNTPPAAPAEKAIVAKNPLESPVLPYLKKNSNRAVRVIFTSKLQKQIAASKFMKQRAAGISLDEIPLEDQMELVELVWNTPEEEYTRANGSRK